MCNSRRAGFQQRLKQSAQHVGLRGDGPEKIQSTPAADQEGRKSFDVQIANQISLVFHIDPYEAAVRMRLCQRAGQLRENIAISPAGATPVGAQTNHP